MKPLSLAAQQAHPQEICHGACSARGDVRFWGLGGSRLTAIPDDCGSGKAEVAVQLLSVLLNLVMVFSIVLWCCNGLLCIVDVGSGCPAKTSAA